MNETLREEITPERIKALRGERGEEGCSSPPSQRIVCQRDHVGEGVLDEKIKARLKFRTPKMKRLRSGVSKEMPSGCKMAAHRGEIRA